MFQQQCLRLVLVWILGSVSASVHADPIHAHIISGAREYESEASMKAFADWMSARHDIEFTGSWGHDGIQELEGLERLESADVLIVFARRMDLNENQMSRLRAYWNAGRPIVGIRTASHAFQEEDNQVFDHEVLGGDYQGHYGDGAVAVTNARTQHPILHNVTPFESGRLYRVENLAPSTTLLQTGKNAEASHPVSWTNEFKGGRMFYTSLGIVADFENSNFRQLLANAIIWTANIK